MTDVLRGGVERPRPALPDGQLGVTHGRIEAPDGDLLDHSHQPTAGRYHTPTESIPCRHRIVTAHPPHLTGIGNGIYTVF